MFGRDPNSLTNARGLLPSDRPHIARVMGTVAVPRTGLTVAGNLQSYSGTPWTASTQISLPLPQRDQRVLLEPRGSRRLPSQTLLDVRVSRTIRAGGGLRIELLADVLNVLNSTAAEGLATDNLFSPNFGKPTVFVDPRRVMAAAQGDLGTLKSRRRFTGVQGEARVGDGAVRASSAFHADETPPCRSQPGRRTSRGAPIRRAWRVWH